MRNGYVRLAAVAAILVAAAVSPSIFFYWRDNFSTHFPYRSVMAGAPALHLWNPLAGGGQPLAGNPNALAFYPDWILFALLPPMAAFNLHFLLHWIGGAFAMRALLRAWRIPSPYDAAGAALWVLSGAAISTLAFYNLAPSVTLIPLALVSAQRFAERPEGRAALFFGGTFGLLALAGEPVTLLATAALAATILLPALRSARAWTACAVAVLVTLVIASPLLLAWSEIAPETERGVRAYSAETVLSASLSPWQLAEALLGPVRGLPTDLGDAGWRASGAASRWPPFFLYLYLGALALPALASPPRPLRRVQVAALVLLFFALGRFNPVVVWIVDTFPAARLLRYPEKLALPFAALVTALVAGWLAKESRGALDRVSAAAGGALIALLAIRAAGGAPWSSAMRERVLIGAAIAIPVLAVAALRPTRLTRRALAAITLGTAAVFAVVAAPVDLARHYREGPAWAAHPRIVRVVSGGPRAGAARDEYRRAAATGEPLWAAAFGAGYALEKSPDGMYSFLSRIVHERARSGDPRLLARWSRLAGASAVVTERPLEAAELGAPRPLAGGARPLFEQEVRRPVPLVHPVRVSPTASIGEAIELLEKEETDVLRVAAGPPGSASEGVVAVRHAERIRDGWRIEVDPRTNGTLLVNESWFRAWRAVDQRGKRLSVGPLNVDRVGISIPRGASSVELRFGRMRAAIAAGWIASSLALLAVALVALRSGSRQEEAGKGQEDGPAPASS